MSKESCGEGASSPTSLLRERQPSYQATEGRLQPLSPSPSVARAIDLMSVLTWALQIEGR